MTGQSGEGTPGQVGPKPQGTGKFKQDGEREKFSSRLHREGSPKETEAAKEERADAKADTHQKKRADAGKGAYREKVADSGKETYREKETDIGKGGSREKAADSSTDTQREEGRTSKEKKSRQEKKQERAQSRAEHSAVRLERAKENLAAQKPYKPPGPARRAATAAGGSVWAYGHRKIHEAEHENVGTEAAHKSELLAEAGAHKAVRYAKRRIREHPARQVERWEHRTMKADAELRYQQAAAEHPELQSNALSRMAQKWKIKRQYAKEAREAAKQGAKAAGKAVGTVEKAAEKLALLVRNHKGGAVVILLLFCVFLIINSVFSALPSLGTGMVNAVVGTSYTAEDGDILGANEDYTALENALRQEVAGIERTHPGYDEYRYRVDELGHNPYELTSYLIAKLRTYTREDVQGELRALFEAQYKLTLTEEVETRYRTETRTGTSTSTDPETGETTTEEYEYEVEVAYEYYILHVRLENRTLPAVIASRLDTEQKELYDVLLELKGNKPYLWDDIYSGNGGNAPGGGYTVPGEALSDPAFAALITEAEKYLGYPYVWGGSSPSTSFDCSGFVCWVYTHSGVHNLPRTTANGILGQCARVSRADARPGDLIFFQGTYNTSGASHVGIYVGDGMMVHCGNPISYASIDTPYWRQHFLTFGRFN
ncbi:C40 family peptidase [uncultured Oscillibacter sp.]|uniref:C40 family peptidase n=1 Tax=uncultured Oscillibacter sp. TaxID=876091 RepID=UPI0025E52681|nr:C40 family peptidase [uncultured Oscillibacter sp.]